ncbi:MAG TPA: DNA-binding protein [Cryomorphaceae bacterium]|nr:DNA-binding protein [Owenweeksia sp.]MBF98255.1 DNA-binding protein [Owenweeksia sp.]HAD97730.1 DNA-binding protein [Cryomorphaceae bacterium]HBF20063.1 DNA-binding protein [Cryomorphaceae bacterium]|tara:strand:- start:310 stop:585 length:276 start_codon:yes stop_codon:yes gene_type:complete
MAALIITKEDLDQFKLELISEFKEILSVNSNPAPKKWLKSYEVREMLGISPGTLQNMRINGTLPYTKVGGLIFYDNDDIQKMLVANRSGNQ